MGKWPPIARKGYGAIVIIEVINQLEFPSSNRADFRHFRQLSDSRPAQPCTRNVGNIGGWDVIQQCQCFHEPVEL